ncbi:hypothetical protein Gogos_021865, partial [Gossypium gossypioides]|nr:hypothetical protein [Gossypium gossypioides]
ANPFAKIDSYKVSGDKVTVDRSVKVSKNSLLDTMKEATFDKVDVIMLPLSTDTLSNNSSYLGDAVNLGGYLAMKENIVVCTSSSNHGDDYYTLSGGLAPWFIEPGICAPGEDILCANKYDSQYMYAYYQVMSGTSIAIAVVTGMLSYIKSFHKD